MTLLAPSQAAHGSGLIREKVPSSLTGKRVRFREMMEIRVAIELAVDIWAPCQRFANKVLLEQCLSVVWSLCSILHQSLPAKRRMRKNWIEGPWIRRTQRNALGKHHDFYHDSWPACLSKVHFHTLGLRVPKRIKIIRWHAELSQVEFGQLKTPTCFKKSPRRPTHRWKFTGETLQLKKKCPSPGNVTTLQSLPRHSILGQETNSTYS